jgi:hypothetical protein
LRIGLNQGEARGGKYPVVWLNKAQMWRIVASGILGMESRSEIIEIKGHAVGLVSPGGTLDGGRKGGQPLHKVDLAGIAQAR